MVGESSQITMYVSTKRLRYLSDAIIRCAFSESTGKIVLGTRNSRIILL